MGSTWALAGESSPYETEYEVFDEKKLDNGVPLIGWPDERGDADGGDQGGVETEEEIAKVVKCLEGEERKKMSAKNEVFERCGENGGCCLLEKWVFYPSPQAIPIGTPKFVVNIVSI